MDFGKSYEVVELIPFENDTSNFIEKTKRVLNMNEDKFTEIILKITSELSALNQNMKTALDRLSNHEIRLMDLEKKKGSNGLLNEIVPWLVKGLVICVCVIATLSGAGAILKPLLGM